MTNWQYHYSGTNTTWGDSAYSGASITISPEMVGPQPVTQTIRFAPLSDLPPVPEDVADDDLAWLGRRVAEIEEFSRIAA